MSSTVRRVIIALALVGFAAAAASAWVHYRIAHDPAYVSFCDINTTVSCRDVYQSRFGSVGPIPVAVFGAFWFGLVALLTVAAGRGPSELARNVGGYLLVLSTVGLAAILFLAYESFFVLGTLCLLCVTAHVAVVGIFLAVSTIGGVPLASIPGRLLADAGRLVGKPAALGVAGGYLAVTVAAVLPFLAEPSGPVLPVASSTSPIASSASGAGDAESEFVRFWRAQPRVDLPVPREGEQVLVLKFNDYQCPSCARSHFLYAPIFARYASSHPGAVRQVAIDYPLDPECNEQTPFAGHMGACEAAVAVRLARREGRDDEMARWLYENQAAMSRETVSAGLAEVAGMTDFDELYDTVLEEVRADIALGPLIGIEATPTYVVNGVVINAALPPNILDAAIALELERAAEAQPSP
jgi:uncharacterized membrane protein